MKLTNSLRDAFVRVVMNDVSAIANAVADLVRAGWPKGAVEAS